MGDLLDIAMQYLGDTFNHVKPPGLNHPALGAGITIGEIEAQGQQWQQDRGDQQNEQHADGERARLCSAAGCGRLLAADHLMLQRWSGTLATEHLAYQMARSYFPMWRNATATDLN